MNRTIFQFFQWYNTPGENLWVRAAAEAGALAAMGITHVWLPPAYKSAKGTDEPGYAVYDLYDLGEFDQKGSTRTKYGTRDEYLLAIASFHKAGIQVLADIVLNHRMGGDEMEPVLARTVDASDRTVFTSDPHVTLAQTRFTFPGRQGRYSDHVWDKKCFSGFKDGEDIKMILHEHTNGQWEEMLEAENGNYDYLMGKDVEFRNQAVREELKKWGCWYMETFGLDGFRLDGLKHITPSFYPEWIDHVKDTFGNDPMIIGEYWKGDVQALLHYIESTDGRVKLFDVPLHYNLHEASKKKEEYDLRDVFIGTLVKERPDMAITFVDNHDTQPLQALESFVDQWFKPMAYALILLREGGLPCGFYISLYGASYQDEKDGQTMDVQIEKLEALPAMLKARRDLAYGAERDYLDHADLIGWTREGIQAMPYSGLAVLLSNADGGEKSMCLGEVNAGRRLVDMYGDRSSVVVLDGHGEGLFRVGARTISIWVDELCDL